MDGFCTRFCGWHNYFTIGDDPAGYKYGWVGYSGDQCPESCTVQVGPNDVGVDGMISVIAHELTEAATDPEFDAWTDDNGYENADKCSWQFGNIFDGE